MEFDQVLLSRRSVRTFTGEKPSQEEMRMILRAAQSAPVGRAEYDNYCMRVVQDPAFLAALSAAHAELTDKPGAQPLFGAPVLIVISTRLPGGALDNRCYSSAAIIAEHIHLQATALGLGSCLIWGAIRSLNQRPALTENLRLPEGFRPVCSVALGKTDAVLSERTVPENRIETLLI